MKVKLLVISLLSLTMFLVGCASTVTDEMQQENQVMQEKLAKQEAEIEALKSTIEEKETELDSAVSETTTAQTSTAVAYGADGELLPPNAKPGECYARVFVPPTYKAVTETVLKKAASDRVEIIPAKYETATEEILVKEASSKLVNVPAKYGTESEQVLVSAEERFWVTNLSGKSQEASEALLAAAKAGGIDLNAAQPGDCFHEHYIQPKYETVTEEVLVKEASEKIETIPAKYETVIEEVLVKEASTKLVNVPTTYKYEEEQVLVEPARTEWKKGRGLVEKVDNATGEIMCLIEVPAVYKTVKRQIVDVAAHVETIEVPAVYKSVEVRKLVQPAAENRITIPAEYGTKSKKKVVEEGKFVWHEIHNMELLKETRTGNQICLKEVPAKYRTDTKTVVVEPAKTETVEVPAVYKTVEVRKLVQPAQENRIEIPAEYQEVTRTDMITDGKLEWRWVLCETNMTANAISKIQNALNEAGYDVGYADGVYGNQTAKALKKYQEDKGLAIGGITKESLESLGITL